MSSQKQDDQLIDQLFAGLKDFLNTPLPGTETTQQKQPQAPAVEEESLLEKLKEILNQHLPGTADEAGTSPSTSSTPTTQGAPKPSGIEGWNDNADTSAPAPATEKAVKTEDWDDLKDRHKDEWDTLKDRHQNERETLKEKHEDEREALKDRHEDEREALKKARKSLKRKN